MGHVAIEANDLFIFQSVVVDGGIFAVGVVGIVGPFSVFSIRFDGFGLHAGYHLLGEPVGDEAHQVPLHFQDMQAMISTFICLH